MEKAQQERVAWSVKHWCAATDLSPAYCYELLAAGKIEAVKIGGKRLITTAPRDFLASLRGEAA
ncbi:MAG: hypothetical protein AB7H71_04850 [Alphaproteobacteria bacterium]